MAPRKIEDSLLVVEGFKDGKVEYRPGDRALLRHRSIRLVAFEHPDWFVVEYETAPVDLDRLREVHADHEADYEAVMRTRGEHKKAQERALREELRLQDEPQPDLEKRLKKQEEADERRKKELRDQAERATVEAEIAYAGAQRHSGFHFDN